MLRLNPHLRTVRIPPHVLLDAADFHTRHVLMDALHVSLVNADDTVLETRTQSFCGTINHMVSSFSTFIFGLGLVSCRILRVGVFGLYC